MAKKQRNMTQRMVGIDRIMLPAYRYGTSPETHEPLTQISIQTADTWRKDGCGLCFGGGRGRYFLLGRVEVVTRKTDMEDGSVRISTREEIVGPLDDKVKLHSPSGASLLWRYLRGEMEAVATVYGHAFGANPVQIADAVLGGRTC